MKISIVLLICVGAVSSFSLKAKRAGDEPFTLTFGSGAVNTGCAYKGATYAQGQQWRDGCQYTCVCEDATSGRYKCTDICPTYADVPPQCPLVKSPGECCAKPQCHFSASGSGSSGSGTGTGMLTSGTSGTGMTGGGSCADKLPNCKDYGADVCTNPDFVKWAHENCCAFCHYGSSSMGGGSMTGGTGTQTGGTMTGGTGTQTGGTMTGGGDASCVDTIDNCAAYTTSVCSDNSFSKWVDEHCRKFCNRCSGGSSGSGTGTMTGTGGTGTGNGGTFFGGGTTGGTGTGTGTGTMTGTGGTGTMTGGTGTMTSGSGTCYDKIPDCAKYTQSTCADPNYTQWVKDNCPKYCGQCGSGTMTGGQTGPGTVILPGGSATYCMDKLQNCKDYPADTCSSYRDWSQTNCAKTCNMCSGGSGTFTGTGTGTGTGTFTGTGTGTGTGTFPGTGTGTGTGTFTGTGTGTGTMTGGTCVDKVSNCAALDQSSHICTDQGAKIYAQQNCPAYCRLCSTGTGGSGSGSFPGSGTSGTGGFTGTGTGTGGTGTFTGTGGTGGSGGTGGVVTGGQATGTGSTSTGYCADVLTNCAAYGTGICTNAQYASWVSANCAKFCNKCSGGSMSGTGTFTGTGTGTGTGSMTGTGSGSVGGMTGSSSGCVYAGHVYQQGQSWKDGCKFSCQCVDGTSGKYQCKSLCVQWQLPQACHMNPPAAGKCCPTPNCPAGFDLQYPVDYVEQ